MAEAAPLEPDTQQRDEEDKATGALDNDALLRRLKTWFRDDSSHSSTWRGEAKEDFDFVTPFGQWTPEDRAALEAQMRPVITFDRCLSIIKAVAGTEINGRHEVQFKPRGNEDTPVNEVLSAASKWMGDECDAEDEQSEAFQHSLITGMGWTEARLDYELDPDGMYIEECISPLEMYWDRRARKKNLIDARRLWRVRKIALSEAREMFPGCQDDDDLDAAWARGAEMGDPVKTEDEKRRREENSVDYDKDEVTLVQVQWWEREPFYRVADPQSNQLVELSEEEFHTLKARADALGMPVQAVRQYRRAYKQAFIGSEILDVGQAPCKEHFSFQCITGEPYYTRGTWYGLIAVMRDPQKWANKWLSQTLHIMNSSAKGGILAEKDAFDDQRQAEESYVKPEAITWMTRNAIKEGKWAAKPTAGFPAGFFQLMEFGISSIRDTTGINLELLGMRDANQPGILEAHRKQSAMTVLATSFDALRRFRKLNGRIRLYLIQNFLSDGRLIRIVGPDGAKVIPLLRDKTAGEYDVVIDDSPSSPNQKEQNWSIISGMLPAFKEQLMARPELLLTVLEYSPLPSALIEALKQTAAQPDPEGDQRKKLALADAVATISQKQSAAELNNAKAGATQATAMYDVAMAQNLLLKHQGDLLAAAAEQQKARNEQLQGLVDAAHTGAKIDTERAKADQIRAQTAGQHVDTLQQAIAPLPDHQDAFPQPVTPSVAPPRTPLQ